MTKVDNSNSWDHIAQLRKLLEGAKHEELGRLEASWQLLIDNKMTMGRHEEIERLSFSPITHMAMLVKAGRYPPPEYLVWLSLVIDEYIEGKGSQDIEVVLFGEKPRGRNGGVYAAREKAIKDRLSLVGELGRMRTKEPGISLRLAIDKHYGPANSIDLDVKLKTLREYGYTDKLYRHVDPDRWYLHSLGDGR